jgi:ABC-2 type transport system ATP-binding protein
MSDPPALEIRALTRRFDELTALDRLDLVVEQGTFFGLLGPNGAGKTTTVSILCTLLKPSEGSARLLGRDVVRERADVRRQIGIVFQEPCLDEALTGRENLDLHARLYHLDDRETRVATELERMGMNGHEDRSVGQLSGGLRRRLEIARGLLHHPRVLFLDEPTLGLDVPARRTLWERLLRIRAAAETTVVLTTHDMEEAARLCDQVAILNAGSVVARGTPRELCRAVGGDHVEFELDQPEVAAEQLHGMEGVVDVQRNGARVEITVRDGSARLVGLIEALRPFGIHAVRMGEASLEDAFLHFTGHRIGPGGDLT